MAKKSRKPNLPQETLQRARHELYGDTPVSMSAAAPVKADSVLKVTPAPAAAVVKPRRIVDLRVEYAYVITDLKNMAILAAALMAVLVALSFVI